jgi:hypothetical protein
LVASSPPVAGGLYKNGFTRISGIHGWNTIIIFTSVVSGPEEE